MADEEEVGEEVELINIILYLQFYVWLVKMFLFFVLVFQEKCEYHNILHCPLLSPGQKSDGGRQDQHSCGRNQSWRRI